MKAASLGVLALVAARVHAHVFCVGNALEFSTALATAASNGEADSIRLMRGVYAAGGFSFNSAETFGVDIAGGYDAGCVTSKPDARLSVLDGGGQRQVLQVNSPGPMSISYLTVQNGMQSGSSGGGLQIAGASAAVLTNLILRNNISDYAVAGAILSVQGDVRVENNLIVNNSAPATAALYISLGSSGSVSMTNNTIAGNVNTSPNNTAFYLSMGSLAASAYISNNIFRGNTAVSDFSFFGNVQLNNNDYGVLDGSPAAGSSGNLSVDPHFVSTGDWHLRSDSPALTTALVNPSGGLPLVDIEGHARSYNGGVDMGAYERGDAIFADAFGD